MTGSETVSAVIARMLPRAVKRHLMPRRLWPGLRNTADLTAAVRYWGLAVAYRRRAPLAPAVPVRMRCLGGRAAFLRPGTSDVLVAHLTFVCRFHLPPSELPAQSIASILDLGANIGLTAAHMAQLYPQAKVLAVELDGENASLARINTRASAQRCAVLHGAAWFEAGDVDYVRSAGQEYALTARGRTVGTEGRVTVPAYTVGALIDCLLGEATGMVDYVKMDIEGAEADVLTRNTAWAERVRSIKVEVHAPYTAEQCLTDLEAIGFASHLYSDEWDAVVGLRT
jgi:FkbM family methyltransferase